MAGKCKLECGQIIGLWEVLDRTPTPEGKSNTTSYWKCRCTCGSGIEKVLRADSLNHMLNRPEAVPLGCGCGRVKGEDHHQYKHGGKSGEGLRLYGTWISMRDRCTNPHNVGWANYGGKPNAEVTVCQRWQDFIPFMEDAEATGYADDLTIDRLDANKGYWCGKPECPECGPLNRGPNYRWVTLTENVRAKEGTTRYEYEGQALTVGEIFERYECCVPYGTLNSRLFAYGWSVEDALTIPAGGSYSKVFVNWQDKQVTMEELSRIAGVTYATFWKRLNSGQTLEEAVEGTKSQKRRIFEWKGEMLPLGTIANKECVPSRRLYDLVIKYGQPLAEAVTELKANPPKKRLKPKVSRQVQWEGRTMSLNAVAVLNKISSGRLYNKIVREGKAVEDAVAEIQASTNQTVKRKKHDWKGKKQSLKQIGRTEGVCPEGLIRRVRNGQSLEQAVAEMQANRIKKEEQQGTARATLGKTARDAGVSYVSLYYHVVKAGKTVEEAVAYLQAKQAKSPPSAAGTPEANPTAPETPAPL